MENPLDDEDSDLLLTMIFPSILAIPTYCAGRRFPLAFSPYSPAFFFFSLCLLSFCKINSVRPVQYSFAFKHSQGPYMLLHLTFLTHAMSIVRSEIYAACGDGPR